VCYLSGTVTCCWMLQSAHLTGSVFDLARRMAPGHYIQAAGAALVVGAILGQDLDRTLEAPRGAQPGSTPVSGSDSTNPFSGGKAGREPTPFFRDRPVAGTFGFGASVSTSNWK
jgi:hypothetical protein